MPIREFQIIDSNNNKTGEIIEKIIPNPPPEEIILDDGRKAILKTISLTARTNASWATSAGTPKPK